MTSNPTVSVIITAYNKERTIEKCLNSVLRQSYPHIEVIVVNDKSTDSTLMRISRYNGIKIIDNASNIGHQRSRMKGVKASHGDFVTFVDGDDRLSAHAVRNCMAHDAQVVQMHVDMRLTSLNIPYPMPNRYDKGMALEANLYDERLFPVQCWGKLYRRSLIDNARFIDYDGFWGEDRLFNMAIFEQRPTIAIARNARYNYKWGGASSAGYDPKSIVEYHRVYELKKSWMEQRSISDLSCRKLNDELQRLIAYDIRQMVASKRYTEQQAIERISGYVASWGLNMGKTASELYRANKPTLRQRIVNIIKQVL